MSGSPLITSDIEFWGKACIKKRQPGVKCVETVIVPAEDTWNQLVVVMSLLFKNVSVSFITHSGKLLSLMI
jgi:hypothetical protein